MVNINLKYQEIKENSLEYLYKALEKDDLKKISTAMVGFVLREKNWKKAEDIILRCLDDKRSSVREAAVGCIGDIARIHGKINIDKVSEKFKNMQKNEIIQGRIEDALDDIFIFVK